MPKRVYLSPSCQEHNLGVLKYGTEEARMHQLSAIITDKLESRGISTRRPLPSWDMSRVCRDSDGWNADIHVCLHTNAGGDGCVGFYGSTKGERLTRLIYKYVAPLSPGKDEGIRAWPELYEIRHTNAPVAYLELFHHTSKADVADYLAEKNAYADAIVHGILDYFGISYSRPAVTGQTLKVPVPVKKPTWWKKLKAYLRKVK